MLLIAGLIMQNQLRSIKAHFAYESASAFCNHPLTVDDYEEGSEMVEANGKKYHIAIKPIWKWLRIF